MVKRRSQPKTKPSYEKRLIQQQTQMTLSVRELLVEVTQEIAVEKQHLDAFLAARRAVIKSGAETVELVTASGSTQVVTRSLALAQLHDEVKLCNERLRGLKEQKSQLMKGVPVG